MDDHAHILEIAQPGIKKPPFSLRTVGVIHWVLFLVTFGVTFFVGVFHFFSFSGVSSNPSISIWQTLRSHPEILLWGAAYAFSLMGILLVHELGHYIACKKHGISATLPFFIPAPTLVGTFGAIIKIRSPITSRNALIDIGVAGPISGFVVAVPVVSIGILLSRVVEKNPVDGNIHLGVPILFHFLSQLLVKNIGENQDILLHPIAFAGWFGLLATAFNLIPIGQLDGGHILYALFGKKAFRISLVFLFILGLLGIWFWLGWLIWAFMIFIFGIRHPPILEAERLQPIRIFWAIISWVVFFLSFTPAPFALNR